MMKLSLFIIMLIMLLTMACNMSDSKYAITIGNEPVKTEMSENNYLSPSAYISYFRDPVNRISQSKNISGDIYVLQPKTSEYIVASELRKDSISWKEYEDINSEISDLFQFTLTYWPALLNEVSSSIDSDSILLNLNKNIIESKQQDIYIIQHQDTFSCILYHFEPIRDKRTGLVFNLGFDKNDFNAADSFALRFDNYIANPPHSVLFEYNGLKNELLPKLYLYE